ncbi:MAG: hypothetical protein EPO06_11945 [Burkholderiaceae bacterium]|nr:MAG: hypothetical protein EPO06_11945 [Burkholderiaceae bacterium]
MQTALIGAEVPYQAPADTRRAPAAPRTPDVQLALLATTTGELDGQLTITTDTPTVTAVRRPARRGRIRIVGPAAPVTLPPVPCQDCHKLLRTPTSRARGRGPVCESRRTANTTDGDDLLAGVA